MKPEVEGKERDGVRVGVPRTELLSFCVPRSKGNGLELLVEPFMKSLSLALPQGCGVGIFL